MGIHATELGFTQDARLGAIDADASTLGEVSAAVEEHAQSLRSIAGDLGLSGLVADAAGEAVSDLGRQLLDLADAVTDVQRGVTAARAAMSTAQSAYLALPEVALTSSERAVVAQYAALPGAGYAADAQREHYLHQHELAREAAARAALDDLVASLTDATGTLNPGVDIGPNGSNQSSSGGSGARGTVPSLPTTTVPSLPRVTAPTIPDPGRVDHPVVTDPTVPGPGQVGIDPRPVPTVDGSVGGTVPGGTHPVGGSGWALSGPGSGTDPSWGVGLAVGGVALGAGGLTRGLATGGGLSGLGAGAGAGSIGGTGLRGGTGVLGGAGPGSGAGAVAGGSGAGTGSTAGGVTALGGGGGATAGRGGVLGAGSASGRTAMPGGGAGGAGSSKKRRRDALGYLAPELDDLDDAALPTTQRGARAGDRDSAALPVALDDEP